MGLSDIDDHEVVHFVSDLRSGLEHQRDPFDRTRSRGGRRRFWHIRRRPRDRDALRLSRNELQNAMRSALGGGKAVISPGRRREDA